VLCFSVDYLLAGLANQVGFYYTEPMASQEEVYWASRQVSKSECKVYILTSMLYKKLA